jgi:hypothetical protein
MLKKVDRSIKYQKRVQSRNTRAIPLNDTVPDREAGSCLDPELPETGLQERGEKRA